MSVQVLFAQYSKRNNSTSRFTDHSTSSGGTVAITELSCFLKESTDSENPVIRLQVDFVPTDFNVCYIYGFNRYYWIRKWEYYRTEWIAYCEIDVLATMREEIRTAEFYILRADKKSNDVNEYAMDAAYPTTVDKYIVRTDDVNKYGDIDPFRYRIEQISQGVISDPFYLEKYNINGQKVISGYISFGAIAYSETYLSTYTQQRVDKLQTKFGSVRYYAMYERGVNYLIKQFADTSLWSAFISGAPSLLELRDPISYLTQAIYIPKQLSLNPAKRITTIKCGWDVYPALSTYDSQDNTIACYSLSQPFIDENNIVYASQTLYTVDERHINLVNHPQISRGRYLNFNPYRTITLIMGSIAAIDIPVNRIPDTCNSIKLKFLIDNITGETTLLVNGEFRFVNNDRYEYIDLTGTILTASISLGFPIQIAQIASHPLEFSTGIAKGIGNLVSSVGLAILNPVMGVGSAISSASNFVEQGINNADKVDLSTNGESAPALYKYYIDPYVQFSFNKIVDEDNEETGRIVCKTLTIGNMKDKNNNQFYGFIKILNGDFQSIYTRNEKDSAKRILENGFFFEE